MSKLKTADFYYGAVLSTLFNNGITPMLIEGGTNRQVYDFITDSTEFRLFVKYRSSGRDGENGYKSWQFVFSSNDIAEIKQFISEGRNLSIGLVCGTKGLNDSEFAVLHCDEICLLLNSGKKSITISRIKGEKAFRLSIGGGRDNAIKIPSNRLYWGALVNQMIKQRAEKNSLNDELNAIMHELGLDVTPQFTTWKGCPRKRRNNWRFFSRGWRL